VAFSSLWGYSVRGTLFPEDYVLSPFRPRCLHPCIAESAGEAVPPMCTGKLRCGVLTTPCCPRCSHLLSLSYTFHSGPLTGLYPFRQRNGYKVRVAASISGGDWNPSINSPLLSNDRLNSVTSGCTCHMVLLALFFLPVLPLSPFRYRLYV